MLVHRANATALFTFVIPLAVNLTITLVFILACVLNPTWVYANSETQELKNVQKQLSKVNQAIDTAKTKQGKAQTSLQKIERDIAERSLRQQQTQDKLNALTKQSAELIIEKDALNEAYLKSLEEVKSLLVTTYKMGRQSGLKRLLSQEDPAQVSRFAQYANYVADSRKQLINHTQALAAQKTKAEAELSKRNSQLTKLSLILEKDQTYLGQLKQNRLNTLDQLDGEILDQSSKAGILKTKEARLTKLVNQLAAQSSKKLKQSKAHAKVYSKREKNGDASTTTRKVTAKTAMVAAGKLPLPVNAKLAAKFGQKRSETGIPWSGILLQGKAGTEVRSIAAGEVVYADWLTGYGQLIIIDHGNDLMSLYGHNRSLNRAVGDSVNQHDLISHMGDTAGLRSAALYFEIRHNGKPQDPLKWCRA